MTTVNRQKNLLDLIINQTEELIKAIDDIKNGESVKKVQELANLRNSNLNMLFTIKTDDCNSLPNYKTFVCSLYKFNKKLSAQLA